MFFTKFGKRRSQAAETPELKEVVDVVDGTSSKRYQRVLVACARWETQYLPEWLAYHRHLGFDHVYLYCNDDDPAELFEAVLPFTQGSDPFLDFLHFGLQGFQAQMYLHFLRNFAEDVEWFMFLDIDEFLILRNYDGVGEFLSRYPNDLDVLYFNWIMAGSSGHARRPDGPVWRSHTRRSGSIHPFTKSLVRSSALDKSFIAAAYVGSFWHAANTITLPKTKHLNVFCENMAEYYDDFPTAASALVARESFYEKIVETAFIYHVAFKSDEDLNRRVARGTGGDFNGQIGWGKFGHDEIEGLMSALNAKEELGLVKVWTRMLEKSGDWQIAKPAPGPNIALGKPALQSSVSEWSQSQDPSEDAAMLVNGRLSALTTNHTQLEDRPWWQVDLGLEYDVHEVRIFNRLDLPHRFTQFDILTSGDGLTWKCVFNKRDDDVFGGVDGKFYQWRPKSPQPARFVRIQGVGRRFITLTQIEIYDA